MTNQVCTGSFVNVASTPQFIPFVGAINEFKLKNLTRSGVTVGSISGSLTSDRIVEAFFNPSYMNSGTALIKQNGTVSGSLAPLQNGNLPQNGFTIFNAAQGLSAPPVALASFTQGTTSITVPASATLQTTVWTTSSAHGLQVGDNVRVYGLTSSPQFGGLPMTVIAVGSTTTFTTLLNSTGATSSVGFVQKVGNAYLPNQALYFPQNRVIAQMQNTNPLLITTLVPQNYQVGDVVTFDLPSLTVSGVTTTGYGTTTSSASLVNYFSGLPVQCTILAVNNAVGAQSFLVNFNGALLGAFGGSNGWSSSAQYPVGFPFVVPQGEGNTNNLQAYGVLPSPLPYGNQDVLSFARQNQGNNGILIGAGDGTNASSTGGIIASTVDAWEWEIVSSYQTFP